MLERIRLWHRETLAFLRAKGGNVAMMFGLTMIPIALAAGAGVDLARAMAVKASMADALDGAALAVGATPGVSPSTATALAQQYFNANFKPDSSNTSMPVVDVAVVGQSVTISAHYNLPTTVLKIAGDALGSSSLQNIDVKSSTTVVWGQTKLWVGLVLDNTGSMSESDAGGTKMAALITASHQLLTLLQGASANPGDVQVSIVPFSKDVRFNSALYVSAPWIDWTDWEAEPGSPPGFSDGPGTNCPWSTTNQGYRCISQPGSTTNVGTIPSTGTYAGYICPGVDNGRTNGGRTGHHYNGCYTSTAATQASTSTTTNSTSNQVCSASGNNSQTACTCSGYPTHTTTSSGSSTTVTDTTCSCKTRTKNGTQTTTCTSVADATTTTPVTLNGWTHAWVVNAHSSWNGCLMDRNQDYDTTNATPTAAFGSLFPAENSDYCPPAMTLSLGYNWADLNNEIDSMSANGNTNQTIGLQHGMMTLVTGAPYNAPALPSGTQKFIILLSDGLNTQNRWTQSQSSIDDRMALACSSAKAAGITIYTIFLDIGGTSGNSSVLQNCASTASDYYDLTTTGSVSTTFAAIGQKITSLRVSQ